MSTIETPRANPLYSVKTKKEYTKLRDNYSTSGASDEAKAEAIGKLQMLYPEFSGISRNSSLIKEIDASAAEIKFSELS